MNEKLDMTLFAQRLKQARNSKGLTQKELSDLSGVSTVMISQYERSDITTGKNPALNNVYSLAKVLGVSIDWLCGNDRIRSSNIDYLKLFIETSIYLKAENSIVLKNKRTKNSSRYESLVEDCENHKICNIPLQNNDLTFNITSDIYRIREIMMTGAATDEMICVLIDNLYQKYKKENLNNLFCFKITKAGDTNADNQETQ